MVRNMFRAAAVSLAGVAVVAVWPGSASAANLTLDSIGGRERVKVTVTSTDVAMQTCSVLVNKKWGGQFDVLPGGKQSLVVGQVVPGTAAIEVMCVGVPLNGQAEVGLANPALDALDSVLIGSGSSTLASDPTLR
ncbi:hypothetical protein [Nocardia salmonicida]|uniref:hypothetical protein n=1 Tax=Nocardia salmonicida TaxID=53431 RepID=UPI002E2A2EFF|nr:hypothetical protein [Nocardia salmonicida]